mgnify:CR=1 FL=1
MGSVQKCFNLFYGRNPGVNKVNSAMRDLRPWKAVPCVLYMTLVLCSVRDKHLVIISYGLDSEGFLVLNVSRYSSAPFCNSELQKIILARCINITNCLRFKGYYYGHLGKLMAKRDWELYAHIEKSKVVCSLKWYPLFSIIDMNKNDNFSQLKESNQKWTPVVYCILFKILTLHVFIWYYSFVPGSLVFYA